MVTNLPKDGNGSVSYRERAARFFVDRHLPLPAAAELNALVASGGCQALKTLKARHSGAAIVLERLQVPGMTVQLHPYQREAVEWMSAVERSPLGLTEHLWAGVGPFSDGGPGSLFYSPVLRQLESKPPSAQTNRGGFLCEQMGLGKTIETIALILTNPRPDSTLTAHAPAVEVGALPSSSSSSSPPLTSSSGGGHSAASISRPLDPLPTGTTKRGGTLVVCNVSLVGQWQSEMKKVLHASSHLKVHEYHGSRRLKGAASLAEFDVVVTTYSILGMLS
jgi:SWI/SNF-related matrix-associated actin-dependent regulator of chromatin subfamily A3